MNKIICLTKEKKIEVDFEYDVLLIEQNLHSPDDNIPALIYPSGTKVWFYEGKRHRLKGPAVIWPKHHPIVGGKRYKFWLDGIYYDFEDWLENHPNQDKTFQTIMKLKYS